MGKQDIIQVLTPDHSVEVSFLDEDATIGDLLASLAEDNPIYGNGFWAIVEVAMPRTSKERDTGLRRSGGLVAVLSTVCCWSWVAKGISSFSELTTIYFFFNFCTSYAYIS